MSALSLRPWHQERHTRARLTYGSAGSQHHRTHRGGSGRRTLCPGWTEAPSAPSGHREPLPQPSQSYLLQPVQSERNPPSAQAAGATSVREPSRWSAQASVLGLLPALLGCSQASWGCLTHPPLLPGHLAVCTSPWVCRSPAQQPLTSPRGHLVHPQLQTRGPGWSGWWLDGATGLVTAG